MSCDANPVVIGSLLALGGAPSILASDLGIALEIVARLVAELWTPGECPLCASGVALEVVDPHAG